MKRLIVNADDFGMAENVNLGIIQGHREGIITSTTLMACGRAAEHAAALARENPGLGVGAHLCLTAERPVTDPARLPTLTENGMLFGGPFSFMARFVSGIVDRKEIEAELRAQMERLLDLGIKPTHVDGHQQLHMMPGVFLIIVKLAREFGVPAIRFPVGPWNGRVNLFRFFEKSILEGLSMSQEKHMYNAGLKRPDRFFGLAQTGTLDRPYLSKVISNLPEGVSELMCHPGLRDDALVEEINWGRGWETELGAVTDKGVKRLVKEKGVELVHYGDLFT